MDDVEKGTVLRIVKEVGRGEIKSQMLREELWLDPDFTIQKALATLFGGKHMITPSDLKAWLNLQGYFCQEKEDIERFVEATDSWGFCRKEAMVKILCPSYWAAHNEILTRFDDGSSLIPARTLARLQNLLTSEIDTTRNIWDLKSELCNHQYRTKGLNNLTHVADLGYSWLCYTDSVVSRVSAAEALDPYLDDNERAQGLVDRFFEKTNQSTSEYMTTGSLMRLLEMKKPLGELIVSSPRGQSYQGAMSPRSTPAKKPVQQGSPRTSGNNFNTPSTNYGSTSSPRQASGYSRISSPGAQAQRRPMSAGGIGGGSPGAQRTMSPREQAIIRPQSPGLGSGFGMNNAASGGSSRMSTKRSMREFTEFLLASLEMEQNLDRERDHLFQQGVNVEATFSWLKTGSRLDWYTARTPVGALDMFNALTRFLREENLFDSKYEPAEYRDINLLFAYIKHNAGGVFQTLNLAELCQFLFPRYSEEFKMVQPNMDDDDTRSTLLVTRITVPCPTRLGNGKSW